MRQVCILLLLVSLFGCETSDSNASDDNLCENPVVIPNNSEGANGYIVSFDETIDVNIAAVEFLEKYEDLEVYTTFPSSNSFHGNSGVDTLAYIQCEIGVEGIMYDTPDALQ